MATGKAERAFHDLAEELAGKGAEASKMFGMPTWKVGGKAFGGIPEGGGLVFKLPPDAVADALKLKGAELFDPGMGRPMKEWVVVPEAQAKHWPELAQTAIEYVSATASKKAPSKKKPVAKRTSK